MKYNLEINGDAMALCAEPGENGRLAVTASEKDYTVSCRRIDRHHLFLTVNGVNLNAFVSGDNEAKQILINGTSYPVIDADARTLSTAAGGSTREPPRDVTPPMPSVVVKVLVAQGQRVQQGDNLVVVSAMKMETTLTAPFDALVTGINVGEGDKVMPGDILIDLEPAGDCGARDPDG